jgi:MFS family permease
MTAIPGHPTSYRGPGGKVPRALSTLIAANVVFGTGLFFHAFLYNFYLDALGHSERVMGNAAAALTLGGLAALLPAGGMTDRLGPRGSLILASLILTVGLAAGAVVEHPLAVYAAAVVAGAGGGAWRVAVAPALMRLADPVVRPRAFGWNVGLLVASGGLGMAVAGAVPDWLAESTGMGTLAAIRVALILGAAGSALSLPLFAALPRAAGGPASRLAGGAGPVPTRTPPVRLPRPGPVMLPLIVLVGVWMLGAALAAPFLNIFFTRRFDLAVVQVGGIFAAAHLLWGASVFVSGNAAGRIGVLRFFILAVALFAPAMIGLAWTAGLPLAVALYLVQGLIGPMTNPLIDQLLLERAPPDRHGWVSGWRNAAADLSALAGASAGGAVLAAAGFGTLLTAAGAVGLAGGLGLAYAVRHVAPASGAATTADPSPAAGSAVP